MRAVVITPHKSKYPDPIGFVKGEQIATTDRHDDEYPGWTWIRTADGKEGWAPEAYLEMRAEGSAVAIVDYSARELDTRAGDAIEVLRELRGWTWCRSRTGEEGWIPTKTVASA